MYAKFASIGAYVPKKKVTNFDLEKIVVTSDEWITKRTGIKERYFVEDEVTSDLATKAGEIAIKRAGLKSNDIDMVIVATITPDYFAMPSTACVVAENLGIKAPAFDISAACTGFIYALAQAKAFIESGMNKNILLLGLRLLVKLSILKIELLVLFLEMVPVRL